MKKVLLDAEGNFVNRVVVEDGGLWETPKDHTLVDAAEWDFNQLQLEAAVEVGKLEPKIEKTPEDYRLLMRAYRNLGQSADEVRVYLEGRQAVKDASFAESRVSKWKGNGPAPDGQDPIYWQTEDGITSLNPQLKLKPER